MRKMTELCPGLGFHRSGPPGIWDSQNCQDWISLWISWNLGFTELSGLDFHRPGPPGIWGSHSPGSHVNSHNRAGVAGSYDVIGVLKENVIAAIILFANISPNTRPKNPRHGRISPEAPEHAPAHHGAINQSCGNA